VIEDSKVGNSEDAIKQMLCEWARKSVAKFKVPLPMNIFLHTKELPKGATGKLDKKGLRTMYGKIVEARPKMSKL
jgi:non-ribosomal peptide synthetase component E (peptide arylation enzyme)